MHITFDPMQNQTSSKAAEQTKRQTGKSEPVSNHYAVMMDAFGAGNATNGIFSYEKEKSLQDVKDQAAAMNGRDYKNYMSVMSHTMSEEDFKELTKDGVHPGKTEVSDAVNIMDHIKANMAEAGVVIDGFNGSADMDIDKLTEITKDAGYARAIANAFAKQDVPLTQENVKQTMEAVEQALSITGMTDEMKQYLLSNDLPVTVDQVYRAMYSSGNMGSLQGGYFADDTTGYFGKMPQELDENALKEQVIQMLHKADMPADEKNMRKAFWMLEKGILLTGQNMEKLMQMDDLKLPLQSQEVLSKIAGAIREGKTAFDASLTEEGIYEKAQRIYDQVQSISEEGIRMAIAEGKTIDIRSLSSMQKQIALSSYPNGTTTKDSVMAGEQAVGTIGENMKNQTMQDRFVHERRMLEEVRLRMTVSANILLLKSNYAIDTKPLADVVDALKVAEQRQVDYGLTLPQKEQTELYQETMSKRNDLFDMPAGAISKVMSVADEITLRRLHEQGSLLKSAYEKAGESYEALMTKPRADLGDRIKNAFGNIDALLSEKSLELSEENRRAVRILAYNQMEITPDNVEKVAQADQKIRDLLLQMSPANTLQMIRDGVNPLDQSIDQLRAYFDAMEQEPQRQAEKFSHFLYQLEQSRDITPEQRKSYIGIFRLIRQIEKQDGKAIGRLVADNRELSFANLLSAVRTGQRKPIDVSIDDSYGMLSDLEKKGVSIADQINSYFDFLKEHEDDSAWTAENYREWKQQLETTTDYVEMLLEGKQLITPDHLSAMRELSQNRGQVYRASREKLARAEKNADTGAGERTKETDTASAFDEMLGKVLESFTSKERAKESIGEMTYQISSSLHDTMIDETSQYLDVRAITAIHKQLSLVRHLAEEEIYEIPAVIDDELTSVSVKLLHDKHQISPHARITIELTDKRQIMASFMQEEDQIKGYIGCNDESLHEELLKKEDEFLRAILSETEKTADISIIKGDVLSQVEQNRKPMAGKQGLLQNQNQAEQNQGGYGNADALYKTVREFLRMLA